MTANDRDAQEALLALLDQPVLLIDGEQITYANDAAMQLLGKHIVGANVRLALRAPSAISAMLAPQGSRALVPSIGTDDSVWELNCQLLGDRQRLVTMQDMSAQRSIARVHADFVANASHELRTPLANILGYVETLNDTKAGSDAETRKRFLGTIRREAERMQSLVEDLMSLSRIEASKHRLPSKHVGLAAICNQIADEFSGNANITRKLPDEDIFIRGDEAQLCQMLRNLVDNAAKYGKLGGEIEISLTQTASGWASLSVSNDGEGVPAEHIPRLTERFYRTDPGRSKAAGGTGLGLSIVKHIVIHHRGRLNISSRDGKGTNITIMLPLIAD
ncbi:MAG: ATP-binding protein [Sphingorhabdus sp.]